MDPIVRTYHFKQWLSIWNYDSGQYCPEFYIFIFFTVFITAFVALNANNKEGDEAESQDEKEVENDNLIEKNNDNDN